MGAAALECPPCARSSGSGSLSEGRSPRGSERQVVTAQQRMSRVKQRWEGADRWALMNILNLK
jgi:hypothetical protein